MKGHSATWVNPQTFLSHPFTHNSSISSIHGTSGLKSNGKRSHFLHAFPDRFGTGMTIVFAPQETADQAHHLAQRGWGFRGLGPVCKDPGGLPFLGIKHHVARQIRAVPTPGDQVQDPPGRDQVNHQGPFQPLQRPQLQRLDPATGFPNPEKISISQRFRYHSMSCTTTSSVSAGRLVSSRHTSAGCPAGGCSSRARIAITVTAGWP